MMQFISIDYFNPLVQFIVKITNYLITPLSKIIKSINNRNNTVISIILIIISVLTIEVLCKKLIVNNSIYFAPNELKTFPLFLIKNIVDKTIGIIYFSTLIMIIGSWVATLNPMMSIFTQLIEPILRPFRRILPDMPIDISPMLMLIFMNMTQQIIHKLIISAALYI